MNSISSGWQCVLIYLPYIHITTVIVKPLSNPSRFFQPLPLYALPQKMSFQSVFHSIHCVNIVLMDPNYRNCINKFSQYRRRKNIQTGKFLKKTGFIHASSVKKAVTRLVDLKILYEYKKNITLTIRFSGHG